MDLSSSFSNPRELLSFLYDTLIDSKRVNTSILDVSDIMRSTHKLTSGDIKRYIKYHPDDRGNSIFNVELPYVDEISVYDGNEKVLPPAGYFTKMRSKVIKRPLGILNIEMNAFETHINLSDNQYLKDRFSFSESGYFIFNFDENIFIQVSGDKINTAKFQMKKENLKLDEIEVENQFVYDYLKREELLEQYLGGLKELYFEQNELIFRMQRLSRSPSKEDIKKYLNTWKEYFQDEFPTWIKLKFIFSQITEDEYYTLNLIRKKFIKDIEEGLVRTEMISSKFEEITSYSDDYKDHSFVSNVVRELMTLTTERLESTLYNGYIDIRDVNDNRIVIENFIEIEKRNMLQQEKVTDDMIEEEKRRILRSKNR